MRWRRMAAGVVGACTMATATAPAGALMSPAITVSGSASPVPSGLHPDSVDLGGIVNDLVFSHDRTTAYATTGEGITVLRTGDWSVLTTIATPGRAFGAALLEDGTTLATALHDRDEVVEIDLATGELSAVHEVSEPWDVEATAAGDLVASSDFVLGGMRVIDRSVEPAAVLAHEALRSTGVIAAGQADHSLYTIGWDIGSGEGEVHRFDGSADGLPVVASSATLARKSNAANSLVEDVDHGRLHTGGGVVLDALDLTTIGSITPGAVAIGANEVYSVTSERITVHDRTTLDRTRSWEPACSAYPESTFAHDAWLSPDGVSLLLPTAEGFCLEPVDGSGLYPAKLVVRTDTTHGEWVRSATVVVLDQRGDVVLEDDIGRWHYEYWLPTGDYFVALARPVDRHGWPLVPVTPSGHGVLDRAAELTTIEGRTVVDFVARPFPYDIIDTSQTYWASIQWLVMTGITKGCGNDNFCPDDHVTRGQMAAFIDRALDLPDAGPAGFTDDTGTLQQNIWNLRAAGITNGCAADRFCPDDRVTRGQMAAFIDRALDLPDAGPAGFTDDTGTFQQNIWNLKAAGITTGCAADRFCTNDFVTRAQMATFLERALSDAWPFV